MKEDQLSAAIRRQARPMTDAEYIDGIRRLREQGESIQEARAQMDFWKTFPIVKLKGMAK